jgi:ribosomal protein S18 acetylase RimI-like enzyme
MKYPIPAIIEDGKLIPCTCLTAPWQHTLEMLYTEFRTEDSKEPPKKVIPFDNERVIRILATNDKLIADADFVAYGMATLILSNHGTGARYVGHVEDVFVSRYFRRRGIGESLMRALIKEAGTRDVIYLELKSNPKRLAAHKLYEKVGFEMIAKSVGKHGTDLFHLPLRTV